ncbi:DUF892 family protein [uncultured Sphingomonas sp.]|uniref:DUF892 family protein n=1 Tax=uncultured Sphingomonas sp. TaxID=158754 RepID=UPI00260C7C93|nr:DUF892 family protein [uncultured Sphingomonas sp.]
MPEVSSLHGLMVTCLRDLRKGEEETLKRFPAVLNAVRDSATQLAMQQRLSDARERASLLDDLGRTLEINPMGDENIWMDGMLTDAEGDMETEEPGPLLDLALIGAVRKMVNASLVSYETAVAVSDRLQLADAAATFRTAHKHEHDAEQALRAALFDVAAKR